ncbi:MAG: hypothetical protein ACLFQX_01850 [Candidatus Kapaibacterium sp.]
MVLIAASCGGFPISDRSGDHGVGIMVSPGAPQVLEFPSSDMNRLDGDQKERLDTIVSYMARHGSTAARIVGYSEDMATPEATRENALDAANMVMHYLRNRGIPTGRMFFLAGRYDESDPELSPNRVEVIIIRN